MPGWLSQSNMSPFEAHVGCRANLKKIFFFSFFFSTCILRQGVSLFFHNSKNVLGRPLCLGHVSISEWITVAGQKGRIPCSGRQPEACVQAVASGNQWPSPESQGISPRKRLCYHKNEKGKAGRNHTGYRSESFFH